ncbi:MAG: hypothetical protein ACAI44_00390 [Candidatus Sericytochromatia bacterium]
MPERIPFLKGWLDIFSQSLLLTVLLLPATGVLYPCFMLWPEGSNGFWNNRPAFVMTGVLPLALAILSLHLLGSWRWFLTHRTSKHPFRNFALERHLAAVALGTALAGGGFQLALSGGLPGACAAYVAGLLIAALVWRGEFKQLLKPGLTLAVSGLWALCQGLGLYYSSQAPLSAGLLLLLGLALLPLVAAGPAPVEAPADPALARPWPWLRLAAASCLGLMLLSGSYLWLKRELAGQQQQLTRQSASQRERLLLERPVLRGRPVAGNGFEGYWTIVGNDCNLNGRQSPVRIPDAEGDRVRTMFDLETGVLVPDPELLERYGPQLDSLQLAAQHGYMQYPFPSYSRSCGEAMPLPDLGRMQDMTLLQLARGLAECNLGACAAGTRQMLDAARILQDLPVYGQVVPMMVAYKLERILVSSLGTRVQPQDLTAAEWRDLLREWRALLAAEEGLFAPVLGQEMLLAQQFLLEMVPEGLAGLPEAPFNYLIQLAMFPSLQKGLPELRDLTVQARDYLALPVHQAVPWIRLIETQKSLARHNPFINNVLIDVVLAIQRYRQHQVILRGFYQHLALQAYAASHGSYPTQLQALVPAWLPALPQDPYTGRPFVYRRDADGFQLYSVGENLRDDGGDGFYGHFVHSPDCSSEELVFAPIAPERCRK